jgi:hypothetical protein
MASSSLQVYPGPTGATGAAIPASISTIASSSSIAITPDYTHLITGTNTISTMTGGTTGSTVILIASESDILILSHGTGSDNLKLRDSKNFGIYSGESVTFQYDGTKWIEVGRNTRSILSYKSTQSAITVSGTSEATAVSLFSHDSIPCDGVTLVQIEFSCNALTSSTSSDTYFVLFEDGVSKGFIGVSTIDSASYPITTSRIFTPSSGNHQYSIKAYRTTGNNTIQAGNGTSGNYSAAYSIITRVFR